MEKIWQIAEKVKKDVSEKFPEIHSSVLQLLINRGLDNQEKIDEFMNPDYGEDLHDPFLFADMEKVVKRIFTAIENKEKIVVYGDYDADGVTSSAVMVETLKGLGADVDIYIPFRETEGYGMNKDAIIKLAQEGANLIITVDCGISNKGVVDVANEKGVDVIITDHHHGPETLPSALAIINPNAGNDNYPFTGLTGVGVAFKVTQALMARQSGYKVKQLEEGFEKWLLDIVAIGTIADMQPLLSENRVFAKYGLVVLNKTRRVGLKTLIKSLGNKDKDNDKEIDERIIGWQISPRLNAAGRLNHASTAYEILITDDATRGEELTQELTNTNQDRQKITERINKEAFASIGVLEDKKILIAVGDEWPTGVVGLVAGKISNRHNRPSMVISHFQGEIIGSARSIPAFNIIEAIEKCGEHLVKFGGHPQAAGFTVKDDENLEKFITKMNELAQASLSDEDVIPILEIDAQVELEEVDWTMWEDLEKFSPFGQNNPKPTFVARDLTVVDHKKLGKEDAHMRLMISHKTPVTRKAIGFFFGEWCDKLNKGDKIDMVFEIDLNEWNGSRELQLKIIDIKLCDDK